MIDIYAKFVSSLLYYHLFGAVLLEIAFKILLDRQFLWKRVFAYWLLGQAVRALLKGTI